MLAVFMIAVTDEVSANRYDRTQDATRTENQINKYSNYIHFQPEWNSYPYNLIFEVSASWNREKAGLEKDEDGIFSQGAKNKKNFPQYINGKPFIEVQYDYTDCQYQWIHYARIGLEFLDHQFGYLTGQNKFADYTSASSTNIINSKYSNETQRRILKDGFAQFIPICTSRETTSYDYTVEIDDPNMGFDVYVVPSQSEKWDYFYGDGHFDHHPGRQCHAQNYQKFSGTCDDISGDSGLLIVIPDQLSKPLTKIYVKLKEK